MRADAGDRRLVLQRKPRPGWRSLWPFIAVALIATAAMQAWHAASQARLGDEVARLAGPADIHMIASVDCVYCAAATRWFRANRVPFSACEIERDPACASAYAATGAPGTPVILVKGRRLVGFDAASIALALRGRPPLAQ